MRLSLLGFFFFFSFSVNSAFLNGSLLESLGALV